MSPATESAQFWSAARVASTAGHAFGVLAQQRVVAAFAQGLPQRALRRIERGVVEAVVGRHAGAAVAHQSGFLELGQVGRHARLRQAGDRRQFGDGQFLALEQCQQAHAGGVGEHLQSRRPAFQIHDFHRAFHQPIAI